MKGWWLDGGRIRTCRTSLGRGRERGEGRREGVPEASGDGTDPIDMTKFRKRIGAEGAELSGEDIQAVPVICSRSKKEHRMILNYLKRTRSEATHTLMAAGENTIFENENPYCL